jgi:CheY-like chemotaxis protein
MTATLTKDLVMIVEDDEATLEALSSLLVQFGYHTIVAQNGREALQKLREATAGLPCIIILDLLMPEMDGWQFRTEQQADPALRDIPVVIVTADLRGGRRAKAAGAVAFIPKPVEVDKLMGSVREFC